MDMIVKAAKDKAREAYLKYASMPTRSNRDRVTTLVGIADDLEAGDVIAKPFGHRQARRRSERQKRKQIERQETASLPWNASQKPYQGRSPRRAIRNRWL